MSPIQQLEYIINADDLLALTRPGRGEVVSRKVGDLLSHRIPRWSIERTDDIREILLPLIDDLRRRLDDEGIERPSAGEPEASRIPKRVRREATSLAALITFVIPFLRNRDDQLQMVSEGLDWARIAEDPAQEAVLCYVRAGLHTGVNNTEGILGAYRQGIGAAVSGEHLDLEVYLRSKLTEWLLYRSRVDDVETETEQFAAAIERIAETDTKRFYRSQLLRFQGNVRLIRGDLFNGITLLQQARAEFVDEIAQAREVGPILFRLAGAYHSLGQTDQAIALLLEMVEICVQGEELVPAVHAFARIGELRLELDDIDGAAKAFANAEQYLPLIGLQDAERAVQLRTLPLFLKTEEYAEGIALATSLLTYYTSILPTRLQVMSILGQLYERNGEPERAEDILRSGFEKSSGAGGTRLTIGSSLARLLWGRGKSEEALKILGGLVGSEPANLEERKVLAACLDLTATIEEERHNYTVAITCLRESAAHRSKAGDMEREALRRNAGIAADLRLREAEQDLKRLVRRRTEQELAEILVGLQKSGESLSRIETTIAENLNRLSSEEIRQVTDLLKRSITEPATENAITAVATEITALKRLEGVDQAFFDSLEERWPQLTTSQKQLCGMIRAGLPTSEIANLLEITHNAVWKKRKRMRKKMELQEDENLEDVIAATG